jgi:uncharacterized protein YjdB
MKRTLTALLLIFISLILNGQSVPSDVINIQSGGAVFSPVIEVTGTPVIEWLFNDGTTSSSLTPTKNYGSAASRYNYLKVTPWSALIGINAGYDAGDGGYGGFALVPNQNVLQFQNLTLGKSSLQYLCASYSPLTELDLREMTELKFIELLECKNLATLQLGTHPRLERLCVEDNNLNSLDLSGCPALGDIRAATNNYTSINWGSIGQELWHICVRTNPQLTENLPDLTRFPKLRELLIWNDNQNGAFICNSPVIEVITAYDNHYSSANVAGCTNLVEFSLSGSKLTSLNLGTANKLKNVQLKNCDLTELQMNYIFQTLDAAGLSTGYLELTGNSTPSAETLVHITNLEARGWTVIPNFHQTIPVTGISVIGANGSSIITTQNGTLQLSSVILPSNASDKTVTWSLVNGSGQATISATGVVTAADNGTVTARATANDGSGVYGTLVITIYNQVIAVSGITVVGAGDVTIIATDDGTLQLNSTVLPSNATDKTVTWSLVNGSGQATINATGLVTAIDNGTVTAIATSNDGSGVYGTLIVTIYNQVLKVSGINVTGSGGATIITAINGTLQLLAAVLPSNATDKTVTWSLVNGTGQGTISFSGLVTAISIGTITAMATANDGSGVYGTLVITINNQITPVTSITVTGAGSATTISADNGSLQLNAAVLPSNATDKNVTWSLVNGTGLATISSTGLVTAIDNGTVSARATANDGSGVYGTLVITIYNQITLVTGIFITGAGGATIISSLNGTLQLNAEISPSYATNKNVTWSIVNGTGVATINATGLVTAIAYGTVSAKATANDGSGIFGTFTISIYNQITPVSYITVIGAGGSTTINSDKGTLQLSATVSPSNATDKTVTWSLINGSGQATISYSGLVTAIDNGTVSVRATANDGSGVYGALNITILNQKTPVTSITVAGAGNKTTITSDNGTLQLSASILPLNATDKTVTWSLVNGTGQATIGSTGLVTAVDNGTTTTRATANDGSGVYGTLVITIYNQLTNVMSINVSSPGGANTITSDNGTLQLSAAVLPSNAADISVTWTLINVTGQATISTTGLVTAVENGTIIASATANDGSGVYGTLEITIYNQITRVTGITVTGAGGATIITADNRTLQLNAEVLPANATDKTVTWSLINGTGQATISSTGLVTAFKNGTVSARAGANDGSGVYGLIDISIAIESLKLPPLLITSDEIKIFLNEDYISWNVVLYNAQGSKIMSKIVNSYVVVLDISSLPPGIYLLVLSDGETLKVAKIVK